MIRRLASSRLLRHFSTAVTDQALLSAANFAVGLLLIRHSTEIDYGHFVLVQAALLLLVSLQNSFIGGPVAVLAPQKSEAGRREMTGGLYRLQQQLTTGLGAVGLAVVAALWAVQLLDAAAASVWGAFVLAGWAAMNREYLRQMLLIYGRPHLLLRADGVYVVLLVATVAVAAFFTNPAAPLAVMGLALAAWAGAVPARAALAHDPGFVPGTPRESLREIAPLGAWATAGAAIYWVQSQGYNYVLAAQLDLAAVAAVGATRLLLMPVNLLTGGIKQLLLPTAAGWYREHRMAGMLRRLLLFIPAAAALAAGYCLLLWLARDWVSVHVLARQLPDRDALLLIWGAYFLLNMVRDLLITALYVRQRFSSLSGLALLCAVVTLGVGFLLMPAMGPRGALLGLLAGELVNFAGVLVMVLREARLARAAPAA